MALPFVFYITVVYIAMKIGEKLLGKIIVALLEKIGLYVLVIGELVVGELGYLLFYRSNIENFLDRMENLSYLKVKVQGLVDAAARNDEVILSNVREWLTNVNQITEEAKGLLSDELHGNLKLRYLRSRNAMNKIAVVDELIQEASSFGRISTFAKAAVVFESRKLIFEKVMDALKDDEINMIGIYGMGGVGKTTLAKQVVEQALDDNLFEKIGMPVVSSNPNLKRIQGEIAHMVDLSFDENMERAPQLFARLKEKKKILIILDDIWERVELEAIGIPFGSKHKGFKIALTTRRLEVCHQMGTQKNFAIGVLSQQEGWNLFQKMAGDSFHSPDLCTLAVQVAKDCAGLPLAIVTVARALQNKSLSCWKDAANQLRKSIPSERVLSALELSYNYLESEEAKSFLLLCCLFPEDWSIDIQDLTRYGLGLGLFQDVDTVDEAIERAHALANSLKSSCLLQDGRNKECVKMHGLIRDVGISIASKDKHGFLVRAGPEWKELPKMSTFKRYTAISLMSDDIHELPDEGEYPNLQILLSNCSHPSLQYPNNFFMRMENLKVLNLSGMHFLSLPPSLRYLKNLRTLCLDFCYVGDVSIIGELWRLEILSFRGSDIKQLPREIAMLTQLRLLDLTGCEELTVIPPDVIQGLSQLEGLYMFRSFDKWEIERQDKERSNASLVELKFLSRLINLEIQIPDAYLFPEDLLFTHLSSFKISVGTRFGQWDQFAYSKILILRLNLSTDLYDGVEDLLKNVEHLHLTKMKGLKSVVYELEREGFLNLRCLNVEQCDDVEYIVNASESVLRVAFPILEKLDLNDLPNLKVICHGLSSCEIMKEIVGNEKEAAAAVDVIVFPHLRSLKLCNLPNLRNFCSKMKCLEMKGDLDTHIEEPLFDGKVAFTKLEVLRIINIENLQEIFHSQLPQESLSQLRILEVRQCHKLSRVAPASLLPWLENLEELSVEECNMMEEVFGFEGSVWEGYTATSLFQLKEVKLWDLPNLRNFCSGNHNFELPSLKRLSLMACPKMQTFCSKFKELWKGDLNSTIQHLFHEEGKLRTDTLSGWKGEEKEVEEEEVVYHKKKKLKIYEVDDEVGEVVEMGTNISAQAIQHEIPEEAEEEA